MPCVHAEAEFLGRCCRSLERSYSLLGVGGVEVGVRLGVKLYTVGACGGSAFNGFDVGVYEK